ncbi:hypothetical protein PVAP13_9NG853300 [Panicum virgatum]|uniref:Uncharacterized protein n=1 Tax=Panicum virgatum TaxID=38727 RepID=A0A8T0N2T2_PANVG|nr:hypothetical protein PVAP13_9NG853300 [Panicum virgatum]
MRCRKHRRRSNHQPPPPPPPVRPSSPSRRRAPVVATHTMSLDPGTSPLPFLFPSPRRRPLMCRLPAISLRLPAPAVAPPATPPPPIVPHPLRHLPRLELACDRTPALATANARRLTCCGELSCCQRALLPTHVPCLRCWNSGRTPGRTTVRHPARWWPPPARQSPRRPPNWVRTSRIPILT